MDEAVEEVIKNIIHIDKSAAELKDDIEKQINDRKLHVDDEIIRLRKEIVDSRKEEIKALEETEISKANADSQSIIDAAEKKSDEMYKIFVKQRENLIKDLFKEIIN